MTSGRFWAQPPDVQLIHQRPQTQLIATLFLVEMPMKLIGVLGKFSLHSNSNSRLGLVLQFWVHSPFAESSTVISCPEIWMSAWLVISRLPFQDISTSHEYTQMYQQTCSWRLDGLCINTQGIKPWILFFLCAKQNLEYRPIYPVPGLSFLVNVGFSNNFLEDPMG